MNTEINSHKMAAVRRTKYLHYSVASALTSKVTTALVQIVALPLAAIALGSHGFSLYSMLTAAVGWLAMSNLGIGPILVTRIAQCAAGNDSERERELFSSAFFTTLIISSFVSSVSMAAVYQLPVSEIFGPLYVGDKHSIENGLSALIAIFFLQINLASFEYAQAGYQKQYVANITATIAGLPCIAAVAFTAQHNPTPVALIVALNGPALVSRIANAIFLMLAKRPLLPSLSYIRLSVCLDFLKNGSIYSLAGTFGNFLSHVFPIILIGRNFTAEDTAAFAVTMNAILLLSGVVNMLAVPLWPAIADSITRGDIRWAQVAYYRLLRIVMALSCVLAMIVMFFGADLFRLWFNGHIAPPSTLIVAGAIYFIFSTWELAHFTVLIGIGQVSSASVLVFFRAIAGAAVAILIFEILRISAGVVALAAPFLVMTACIALIDMIPMQKRASRALLGKQ